MIRQTTRALVRGNNLYASRMISTTVPRYSIVDAAKEAGHKANMKVGKAASSILGKAEEKIEEHKERERVNKNYDKDYKSLKDKGSKVEEEQNRPDDAM